MTSTLRNDKHGKAIDDSWDRCKYTYSLAPDSTHSILRLQSSEVTPRLEALVELTGGRRGIFKQVSEIALTAGHCLVVTDSDQIIVRCDSKTGESSQFERHGIALGSCWNERIAGTNGVAMATALGEAFTVRGKEHFFSKLRPFACTAIPLLDAHNTVLGTANLSTIDHGNTAEYLFQKQLLEQAARKIQHVLFEQHFSDSLILSVSDPGRTGLLSRSELIAVDNTGVVCGATSKASNLPNGKDTTELKGQDIEEIVGFTLDELIRNQGKQLGVQFESGLNLNVSVRDEKPIHYSGTGTHNKSSNQDQKYLRGRLTPSLKKLATGSRSLENIIEQSQVYFFNSIPFLIEGESGTGKTTLVKALHSAIGNASTNLVIVDCAALADNTLDETQIGSILEHARVAQAMQGVNNTAATLVLERISELPSHGQVKLRSLLENIEIDAQNTQDGASLRVVATTRENLLSAVNNGKFRDDLYYLLCGAYFVLPPLHKREGRDILARSIAKQLAGADIEFTDESIAAIHQYPWPGNVRELRSALRQSLIAGNGERISMVELSQYSPIDINLSDRGKPNIEHTTSLENYDEKERLMDALLGANWNVSRAARNLGIGRATIHRKMKQFEITRPRKDD